MTPIIESILGLYVSVPIINLDASWDAIWRAIGWIRNITVALKIEIIITTAFGSFDDVL